MKSPEFLRTLRLRKRLKNTRNDLHVALSMDADRLSEGAAARAREALSSARAARTNDAREVAIAACEKAGADIAAEFPSKVPASVFEIVETLVVAFGVAMAFRAYFFQPFKIPTGSMQPTLYGLHSVQCERDGVFDTFKPFKIVKWIFTGSWYRDVTAKTSGSLVVSSDHMRAPGMVILTVAGERYKVPQDVIGRDLNLRAMADPMPDNPATSESEIARGRVNAGDRIWSGYVISGDQVFVNRMAWNFRPPRRDEICVFATSSAEYTLDEAFARDALSRGDAVSRVPFFGLNLFYVDRPIEGLAAAQHYIKRLVGLPGETISIDMPRLLVNGEVPENCPGIAREISMEKSKTGPAYTGYRNTGDVAGGTPPGVKTRLAARGDSIVLGDEFLPMGDNTVNSYDGRYWGPVPRTQMLGPAACVYWPVSVRWGVPR